MENDCKVMKFRKTIFEACKVVENNIDHGKLMKNDCKVMGVFITTVYLHTLLTVN